VPLDDITAERYVDFVKQYLDLPTAVITGTHVKVFAMLGDSVSVCIIKALYPSRGPDALRLTKILTAISTAFQYRNVAQNVTDRLPAVSLWLLETLLTGPYSPEQKDSIRVVIERLKNDAIAGAPICPCSG
jgi:hypothetical protein